MKKATVGLCLVLALGLASCGTKTQTPDQNQNSSPATAQTGAMMDPMAFEKNAPRVEETVSKVGDKLKEEPAFRACMSRSIQMCSSEVVSRFAQEKDSDESCNVFEDAALKESCVNAINTELARKKMDTSLCSKLTGFNKDNCEQQTIIAKATKEKDPSICSNLKTPKAETSSATGAAMMPAMMVDRDSQCVMQVVMMLEANEKALEACKTITNEAMQSNCTSMVKSRMEMQKGMIGNPAMPAPPVPTSGPIPPGTGVSKTGSVRATNTK